MPEIGVSVCQDKSFLYKTTDSCAVFKMILMYQNLLTFTLTIIKMFVYPEEARPKTRDVAWNDMFLS